MKLLKIIKYIPIVNIFIAHFYSISCHRAGIRNVYAMARTKISLLLLLPIAIIILSIWWLLPHHEIWIYPSIYIICLIWGFILQKMGVGEYIGIINKKDDELSIFSFLRK